MASRVIVEDTRQKSDKHDTKHVCFTELGVTLVRHELEVGDYTPIPVISVDTKRSIVELAGNIRTDHERFRAECVKAQEQGTLLVILVENEYGIKSLDDLENWNEPKHSFVMRHGKEPYRGAQIAKACRTMTDKYDVLFRFCDPEESAKKVIEILERGERWIWEQRLSNTQGAD